MKDVQGELWNYPADMRCITTNGAVRRDGACVMGRGCAQQARDSMPGVDLALGRLIERYGNRCFWLRDFNLATFVVKHHWRDQADLALIERSCRQISAMADKFGWASVVIPRPGCGNGRLGYKAVRPILEAGLDDRFLIITW